MRIAFILPGRGRSGGIRCTVIAANLLLVRGHKVRIFYAKESFTPKVIFNKALNKFMHRNCHDWVEDFRGDVIAYDDITESRFLPDEIIVSVGMWCSSELSKIQHYVNPKVQYIHGLTPWMPEVMDEALSLPFPKIAVSSQTARKIESYDVNASVKIIHNGIDSAEYYPGVDKSFRNGIGTIYSSHPAKDPETVLRVLAELRKDMPDVRHYIFGSGRRPTRIPKTDYKRYPSVEDARYRYSYSKVWLLMSSSEGFPGPVLEAMACGCAVVSTDCGGVRDIVIDGENGFIVEIGNVKQIVDKVKLLLRDEELRQRISESGLETVKRFSWDASVSKLEQFLEDYSKL